MEYVGSISREVVCGVCVGGWRNTLNLGSWVVDKFLCVTDVSLAIFEPCVTSRILTVLVVEACALCS